MRNTASLLAGLLLLTAPLAFAGRDETMDEKDFENALNSEIASPGSGADIPAPRGTPVAAKAPAAPSEERIPTISADKSLPSSAMVAAIPEAQQRFRREYAEFPDSAEKWYMEASYVTRAWVEAGGDVQPLLVSHQIDWLGNYQNPAMEKILLYWLDRDTAVMAGEQGATIASDQILGNKIQATANELAALEAREKTLNSTEADRLKTLRELNKQFDRYVKFRLDEMDWEKMHPGVHESR